MKSLVRGLFACAGIAAGLLVTGCHSPEPGPLFMDSPLPRVAASSPSTPARKPLPLPSNGASAAVFRAGDTVKVIFSGPTPIEGHEEPIKEDGTITLPLIGSVVAAGKTTGELQNEIHDAYVPKYYVRLTVTVSSGDRVYYVGGEVNSHGSRQLYVDGTTVTKAIISAGGLTDFANHSKVWLTRASNGQRIRVDYDEAIKNQAKDPPVYPNDQITVDKRIF